MEENERVMLLDGWKAAIGQTLSSVAADEVDACL